MPMDKSLKKVLILGSGPIIIGQGAEFDYSGTQACTSLREEGIEVVLVNSNPATIMTDENTADKVYIEPLNEASIEDIIKKERPDGILAGFGGQTALNLAMKLKAMGILDKYNVRLLGITQEAIIKAEDREEFKKLMEEIKEPIAPSIIAENLQQCEEFASKVGYPLIIRPAYTLGGTGGGIANNLEELKDICTKGLLLSPIHQILLEESLLGFKEIEYEVIRDKKDNCIIICNMENLDPVGVHTGDSIVVAPSQTLTDKQYHMLRSAAKKIIRALKIEGGCNIQYALNKDSNSYRIIEVNPRVSRSSALASKATGYPIAKVSSKIAIGYSLDELKNSITKDSSACFEPSIDYIVCKIPKLPFDKFPTSQKTLGTQMKATGEVMSIDRTFEGALLKAMRSLETKNLSFINDKFSLMTKEDIIKNVKTQNFERIYQVAYLFRKGMSIEELHNLTSIDRWFLQGIKNIVDVEESLKKYALVYNEDLKEGVIAVEKENPLYKDIISAIKIGMPIKEISSLSKVCKEEIKRILEDNNLKFVYKMVDTCGGEFEAKTSYYYSSLDEEDESGEDNKEKILVLGSGPIRIGQGIEFDYCCVHGVEAIKKAGYKSIIINNNPETVSTDFDTADKLYLEPLCIEDVMRVIEKEKPKGVVVQFGGQTAINLAKDLDERGVNILGTSFESIDKAEDREKFLEVLDFTGIEAPKGYIAESRAEIEHIIETLGFPVIIRPSYVIGGRAMQIVYDDTYLDRYLLDNKEYLDNGGLLIDKYIMGKEIEVDALCDGRNILIPGIMEHIERAGVHSGDSISMYPATKVESSVISKLVDYTERIAVALEIKGVLNIQYVYDGKEVRVIEVNPRASRTVPILSKLTGVPMINIAVDIMIGKSLDKMEYGIGLYKKAKIYGIKVPVFSSEKLHDVDTFLGPEMKSTGEVLGVDTDLDIAVYKAFEASGVKIPKAGNMYVSLDDTSKDEGIKIIKDYLKRGFEIFSFGKTFEALNKNGIFTKEISEKELMKEISSGKIQAILNTPTKGDNIDTFGFKLRRKATEFKIPLFTCNDTCRFFLNAVDVKKSGKEIEYKKMF